MPTTTLTSREANQDFSRAKRASKEGPVIITERGKPALVLLSFDEYQKLVGKEPSILDLLAMPESGDIDWDPPPRAKDKPGEIDLS